MKVRFAKSSRPAIHGGALLAVSLALLLASGPLAGTVGMYVTAPVRPLQWLALSASRALGSLPARAGSDQDASVAELRQRIRRLEIQLARQKELAREARRKLENLGVEQQPDLRPVTLGDVIAYDSSNWHRSLVVGQGATAGVERGMIAVWDGAVVGRVTAVGPLSSRVRLITAPNSRVAVRSARSRAAGLLEGTGTETCRMKYVGYRDDVKVDDALVTAGIDGLFPPHLIVGTCVQSDRHTGEILRRVVVRPAVSPRTVESVTIADWQEPPVGPEARPDE